MGNQSMARQCLVVAIMHQPAAESSASTKRNQRRPQACTTEGGDPKKFFQVEAQLPNARFVT